jgi:hypothetical protein
MQYPIEYKTIKVQHAFLVEKVAEGYRVRVKPLRELSDQTFQTEAEAREYINTKELI